MIYRPGYDVSIWNCSWMLFWAWIWFCAVAPSIPPAVSYTKRSQANSVEGEKKEECKLPSSSSKGDMATSPLVAQERRKSSTASGVRGHTSRYITWRIHLTNTSSHSQSVIMCLREQNSAAGGVTRRNTYVCERSSTDRYSAVPNGKDSRWAAFDKLCDDTDLTTWTLAQQKHWRELSVSIPDQIVSHITYHIWCEDWCLLMFPLCLPHFCLSLTEMSASASASSSVSPGASSALASTRPRHVKSMSASGHPNKSPLPPIEDNAELKGWASPHALQRFTESYSAIIQILL